MPSSCSTAVGDGEVVFDEKDEALWGADWPRLERRQTRERRTHDRRVEEVSAPAIRASAVARADREHLLMSIV
jgi:hypothetical protein